MKKVLTRFLLATTLCIGLYSPPLALAEVSSLSGSYLASRSAGRNRDNDVAVEYLRGAIKLDPGNAILIDRLFQLELANGSIASAENLGEKVIAFNSQHRMARVVLGLKEFRARRYDKAREHFAEASYTPVGELTAVLLTAWAHAGEGNVNAALSELDKLDGNESFGNFKSFHAALINDYAMNSMRADIAYRKAYADAGTSLRVVQSFGNFLARNGKSDEAAKIYSTFLETADRNVLVEAALSQVKRGEKPTAFIATPGAGAAEALFSLAAAMNDDQSIDVALLYGQLALSLNADRPVVVTLLGDILASTQRYEAAIDMFEQVPANSELRTNADTEIAVNLQRLDRPADSQSRLRTILEREPKNQEAWITLGNVLRSADNYSGAVEAYGSALALEKDVGRENWAIYYYRGIAFERMKLWDKAEGDFRKALSLSPEEPSILNYLGYSLIDKNMKLDEAIAMVKKAVELKPNDGFIVDSLGWAYFQLGDYEQALIHMERAVDLKPGDAIIAEHLGDVYWRVERRLEAQFQWQHAKDNKPEPADLIRIEEKLKNGLPPLPPQVKPADAGSNSSGG